jgi:hypothetical protein
VTFGFAAFFCFVFFFFFFAIAFLGFAIWEPRPLIRFIRDRAIPGFNPGTGHPPSLAFARSYCVARISVTVLE